MAGSIDAVQGALLLLGERAVRLIDPDLLGEDRLMSLVFSTDRTEGLPDQRRDVLDAHKQPIIRKAKREDVARFYNVDKRHWRSVMAYVGELDGELLGIGGIAFIDHRATAFFDLKPEGRRYKKLIMRTLPKVLDEAKANPRRRFIYANPDPNEPLATKLIAWLGFRPLDDGTGWWRWDR